MSKEIYAITDIEGYANGIREAAAKSFSYNENVNDYITVSQMISIINEKCLGFDDQDRPLLNEKSNEEIYEVTLTWMHNVNLAKLAAKNLLECAWDDKNNEMIFWSNNSSESPCTKETKNGRSSKNRNKKKNS